MTGIDSLTARFLSAHSSPEGERGGELLTAAHSAELQTDQLEWIQLLPAGQFSGVDGRGPYQSDAAEVVRRTAEQNRGRALAIDYGHALERPGPEGDAAPAAGWIEQVEDRAGEVWGRVQWTEEGGRRVKGREYRFLSPVFFHDKHGTVISLLRAGLTNRPNLFMAAIHAQGSREPEEGNEVPLKEIAGALGLAESSDEPTILSRCSAVATAAGSRTKVVQALQLPDAATDDEILRALHALQTPDPGKYVPMETYTTTAQALSAAQLKERTAEVDALITARKLSPAQRGWALSYHARDPEGFRAFAEKQPVIMGEGSIEGGQPPDATAGTLTEAEKAVCAQLGLSEAEYLKNREG